MSFHPFSIALVLQFRGVSVSTARCPCGVCPADVQYYHPKRYFKVDRPTGIDYIGEIEIEEGKSVHGACI